MLHELLSDLRYRFRALFRRGTVERELDQELRFHIEQEAEKHVRAGLSRGEALRRARLTFGGIDRIKEDTRDVRGVAALESVLQDLRYAVRALRARPAFTLGVTITLGLGIGANATMFGIVDRLLLRPPPTLRGAGQVHRVYVRFTDGSGPHLERNLEFARYLDFARWSHAISRIAAFQTRTVAVGDGDDVQETQVSVVSASYFDFFAARPALGRFFTAEEDSTPLGTPVVVLGYAFWQTRYGGRTDVIGGTLRVDKALCTIIGVAPEGFVGMTDQGMPAAYMPITAYAASFRGLTATGGTDYSKNYNWSWLELIVRRKDDVSETAAETDLTAAYQQSWRAEQMLSPSIGPVDKARPQVELGPVQFERGPLAGRDAKVVTWVGGVALIVLLIACANVANLLLSRAVSRQREIAMRLALGVRRGRLIRQLLTESLVLASLGGVAGLAIAQWGAATLRAVFLPAGESTTAIADPRTLGFAALATIAAALLTGLVPALHAGRADVAAALKTGGGAREGTSHRSRTRRFLLLFQATLSVVLLVGAGLFVRSLQNVRGFRLGYDVDPVLFAAAYNRGVALDSAQQRALIGRMLDAARATPGIARAAVTVSVPFYGNEGRPLFVEGIDSVRKLGRFILQSGSTDYFVTMGTRILRGRAYDESDRENGPRVVVVSEGMARTLWPGREALGQCLRIERRTSPCTTVVGIAEEAHIRMLADPREFTYYLPITQYQGPLDPQILARVNGDPSRSVGTLRHQLQREMPGNAYVNVIPLRRLVDPNLRAWHFGATMFVAFGGLALVLAAIGLYSLIAYDVAQRTREIGVRLALGASVSRIMSMVVSRGMRLVFAGVVIGGAIALWAGRWLEPLMFRQSTRDPLVFGLVAFVLLVVALVAGVAPALRAARVDPSVTLRAE